MARGRGDDEGRIGGAHWNGSVAQCDDVPLEANPHEVGTDEWWAWRIGWLQGREEDEWEASDEGQAAILLEEQPRWERKEALGANAAVRNVQWAARSLGDWLGMYHAPGFFIDEARTRLRRTVDELLALRAPQESRPDDQAA